MSTAPTPKPQPEAVAKVADMITTLVQSFMATGFTFQESLALAELAMRQSLSWAAQRQAQAKPEPE